MGTENSYIAEMQSFLRRNGPGSRTAFLYGTSQHNQRIESWWGILRKECVQFWMEFFEQMKQDGYFTGDFIDKSLIQYFFMDIIRVVLRFRDHPLTCSGTLVNNNSTGELVVLTAAQCVDGTLPVEWTIDVGVHSRSAQEQYQKTYDVKKIISHPEYSPFLLHNDIAIVRLSTPVVENEAVAPICVTSLPSSDFYGKYCVVTGWGATSEGGSTSDRLKEVYKPVLTDTDCLLNVGGTFNSTTMLCAGFVQGGEGTCTGDDGGPLACKNVNGQWDLIGIVSWGYLCARESYPAVYTDVHHFLDWIGNSTLV
ncbi:Hypothetical predicted protein [Mytilus galloprovincialis]|uniref:Peptidase S1 domain-containing protein n=1 Tax=Mytilus galloprovincialis TaxID=29158 RepID=A0A8B6DK56_MYTGA|nr:Hypothetical predicted protein [Mytilus galloprovincialis]